MEVRCFLVLFGHLALWPGPSDSAKAPIRQAPISVTLHSEKPLYTVDERFVSFTLDSGAFLNHLPHTNDSWVRYQNIARGLSPGLLRVGGTNADRLVFGSPDRGFKAITVEDFDRVCMFCKKVGWDLSFDLNLQFRNNGKWNPSNAQLLMNHAASKGFVVNLELGNEPDLFDHAHRVAPTQIGRDFVALRHIMDKSPAFRNRALMGPGLTQGFGEYYLQEFLQTGSTAIDYVSVHHYYGSGHYLTPAVMVDPRVFNGITSTIHRARDAITKSSKGTHTLWLAEAGLSWSRPAPSSTGFIAGFMWMDTLGMSAANNVSLVARQTYGSFVGENAIPTPEYWMTLLFKRLVGTRVLRVTSNENNHYFRIYAHCSRGKPGAVTFYYMNLYGNAVAWTLPSEYRGHTYDLYSLTVGGDGTMSSSVVNLNGHPVSMNGDNVPVLHPVKSQRWPVVVPSLSYGFLVLPNINPNACH